MVLKRFLGGHKFMDYTHLLNRVEKLVGPVVESLGLELIEREIVSVRGRWVLRLYIDRETSPVTLDDCERASKTIERILDVEDLMNRPYSLEVSSPGLDRPLRREKDFERFAGALVEVITREPIRGRSHFSGVLIGLKGEEIVIRGVGEEDWHLPFSLLKRARLKPNFQVEGTKRGRQ